ncbi:DUF1404 family protein [Acidianus manzaensis]|uniref:DUF1404 domain-containing protein n=1 Tax=Acidianus manzaensis TaxID=282676 RepID=A0A1W6JZ61_9CREN|nr:DUF1404 family protein [Acidianus manzaensis]ARM75556.1 hypothetical protein B6F84_05575 [Acidianus manzaensis]
MELRDKKPYLFIGIAMVIASINPLSLYLAELLEIIRVSFDMSLVWGTGLIGIWIADYMFKKGIGKSFLQFNFTTRGLILAWGIAGTMVCLWYVPNMFDLSVLYITYRFLQLLSFFIAGIIGGIGWYGMTNVWKSISMFAIFSMMASMAEIFLELGTYYETNLYSAYSISQFVDTSYFLFAMAFAPSTFYMVKWLKDLNIF